MNVHVKDAGQMLRCQGMLVVAKQAWYLAEGLAGKDSILLWITCCSWERFPMLVKGLSEYYIYILIYNIHTSWIHHLCFSLVEIKQEEHKQ